MSNQLIPWSAVAKELAAEFDKMTPAELAPAVYVTQTQVGGFPVVPSELRKLLDDMDAEEAP